jgi:hypothetical protein
MGMMSDAHTAENTVARRGRAHIEKRRQMADENQKCRQKPADFQRKEFCAGRIRLLPPQTVLSHA